uniref:Major facilitator superfamily (MFS) profile domain-containing protein n=1 Tax=Panagrolaimus sp. JU765 TaxID=591449 RepID=A0AC34R0D2_9BILA
MGRRPMILIFLAANTASLAFFVIFAVFQPRIDWFKYGCLGCFLFYGVSYGGVGPITWFIPTELVPQRHRSVVQSLCYAINTLIVVVWTFTVLPLFFAIGAYAFLGLYVAPNFFCFIYLYFELPETKNREIHEIVHELRGKTTTRLF